MSMKSIFPHLGIAVKGLQRYLHEPYGFHCQLLVRYYSQFKCFCLENNYHLPKAGKIWNISDIFGATSTVFCSILCFTAPSDPPKDVHYANLSSSSIILFWMPPSKPNGVIQHYSVYYSNTSGTFMQVRPEWSPSFLSFQFY